MKISDGEAPAAEEAKRLAALRALGLLDTPPEAIFDRLTQLAALTFRAPVALVTLVDAERQWFKACLGLDIRETPRDVAFCDYTIRQSGVFVVADALVDPRFRDNPLVTGHPYFRFYAGAPLISAEGHPLGSLCILDFAARDGFSAAERAQLEAMAAAVTVSMTARYSDHDAMEHKLLLADEKLRSKEAQLRFFSDHSPDLILRVDPHSTVIWVSPSCSRYGYQVAHLLGSNAQDLIHPDDLTGLVARKASRFASLEDLQEANWEYRIKHGDGRWVWVEENPTIIRDRSGRTVEIVSVLRDISDRKRAEGAAADIQSGMLLPRAALATFSPRVEVDAILQPARNVGGDLYDAFIFDEDRLFFVMGDVTGKGVAAALFMALAKALSHSLMLRSPEDLGAAVSAIDAELARNNREEMALSLLVGRLDLDSGRLQLCNAGHEDPMVLSADGAVSRLRLEGGPPLCVAKNYPYKVETHHLARGAAFVAVTDGVTEAENPAGEPFGRARTQAALQATAAGAPLTAMLDGLVAAVRAFEEGRHPSDDLTALTLRRRL